MTFMVRGIFKDGKLELLEVPEGLSDGRVQVLIIEEPETVVTPRFLEYGKYKGDIDTTLEDFKAGEWHGS